MVGGFTRDIEAVDTREEVECMKQEEECTATEKHGKGYVAKMVAFSIKCDALFFSNKCNISKK